MKSVLILRNNEEGRVDHARSTVKGSDRNTVWASSVFVVGGKWKRKLDKVYAWLVKSVNSEFVVKS